MKRQLAKITESEFILSRLWSNKIKQDCNNQNVFLTIRDNRLDLYHKGGKLFDYDRNGFKTHLKYASVITSSEKDYLTEHELANHKLANDFETNYERIKENCSNYAGIEASGISDLYHKHSYVSNSNVVVLDIEVSFNSIDGKNNHDRIDILLYNKDLQRLKFVEAKHFSNKDLWSQRIPKVINQIKRYESQITQRKVEVLAEYLKYIRIINRSFNIELPTPIDIEDKVTLFIFGFDNDQKNGRLNKHITKNPEYSGIQKYSLGNIKKINTENLWNAKVL